MILKFCLIEVEFLLPPGTRHYWHLIYSHLMRALGILDLWCSIQNILRRKEANYWAIKVNMPSLTVKEISLLNTQRNLLVFLLKKPVEMENGLMEVSHLRNIFRLWTVRRMKCTIIIPLACAIITEQIYVGSCIQTEDDVETLSNVEGITAVLNFQSGTEAENWGINVKSINDSCQRNNILMINYPIRDGDSYDMRKKLPFCVGLLLRLLRKNHRVFVTCTSGFDRSPACVIAYLHWMTDVSLHAAYTWVTGMHTCRPDRPAIAWATWDLIAMVERGKHDGPPTHAVTFVWNGHEGEDVTLVGDFTGNWKEPLKAVHRGGSRHEVEVKLPQGKYYYKFIVNGQWKHSTASPAERDDRGNVNNIIAIGETASIRPSVQHQQKDANVVKVIERPLNEKERFMLAKAARCIAFSVCPIRLAPK
ncbi:Phosphoglucan phosphatase lsf1, chloroplastic, variant 2 [Stylosanthes scabra]|uniref:Phosphoglucan phosphatase lsf1, chloroplastic, variant 2 n=1 Tax=Stylosanthes scabra TaxID=79078 RepID=A0ABU6VN45_9FABA|nr:Phosphoglucan phosphatase lsf1, chloroplastic, variant 2 [Stylosanthes scabra]